MRAIVIGAGVIGGSIAAELAKGGAETTLIDQGVPGGGTTSTSFAWINANNKEPQSYYDINNLGRKAHQELDPEGRKWLGTAGHIEIADDEAHAENLRSRVGRFRARGYEVEEITPEEAWNLLPGAVVPQDAKIIIHYPAETYAYPLRYLGYRLEEARVAGAEILTFSKVEAITHDDAGGGTVTLSNGKTLEADVIVIAAGIWTKEVAALAGVDVPLQVYGNPGDRTVGYLFETNPLPVPLDRQITAPKINIRPQGGGRLLVQALDLDATADPTNVPDLDSPLCAQMVERLKEVLPGAEGARIERLVVGQRPMPEDGRTIAGPVPGCPSLYVTVTHSGVTLAPFLGTAVASEIFGQKSDILNSFRLDRFANGEDYGVPTTPRKPGEQ